MKNIKSNIEKIDRLSHIFYIYGNKYKKTNILPHEKNITRGI